MYSTIEAKKQAAMELRGDAVMEAKRAGANVTIDFRPGVVNRANPDTVCADYYGRKFIAIQK